MTEVALFPIPGMVTLPYTTVPLHVFEPRYRNLIKDSIERGRPIAVCHTKRVIHKPKYERSLAENLNSNQSVYEPVDVFAAGPCRVLEALADGRMIVEIDMEKRYRRRDDLQMLPYRVSVCEEYVDEKIMDESPRYLTELRARIDRALIEQSGGPDKKLAGLIQSAHWQGLSDDEYSFKVFQTVQFDPDLMQMLLEIRTVEQRLLFLAQALQPGAAR